MSPWRQPRWSPPSAGAEKPARGLSPWWGEQKARPQTVQFQSGRGTPSIRGVRKMWTYSGQSGAAHTDFSDQQSWLPGAINTGQGISPRAIFRARTVSG